MVVQRIEDIRSPAKLNLFLHVTGRSSNGYHFLQSVFVPIDWCDVMHFELRLDAQITRCDVHEQKLPKDDLSVRAAQLLKQESGVPYGVTIFLDKHIPMQAGLGGGSSNAATTLLALNQLWDLKLSITDLMPIAQQLGSDVPFFLHGKPAWVEGFGEKITPIELPEYALNQTFAVLKPEKGVATQQIFNSSLMTRDTKPVKIYDFLAYLNDAYECKQNAFFGFGGNDLQQAAIALEPEVSEAINWLKKNDILNVRMTGSGSAVFGEISKPNWSGNFLPLGWKLKKCKILCSGIHAKYVE